MVGKGSSHLDSSAIKVRLRKPKKKERETRGDRKRGKKRENERHARKEWNLIRSARALSYFQAAMKQQDRTAREVGSEGQGQSADRRKTAGRQRKGV